MKRIKSYVLFESELHKLTLADKVIKFLPRLQEDSFTVSIIPYVNAILNADSDEKRLEAYQSIRNIAKKHFGGFNDKITMQEVLERFVNHYLSKEDGILRMRYVKKLIRAIKPPVKRSLKADRNYKITGPALDNFTDRLIKLLEKEGIKELDIKNKLKEIYLWFMPVLKYFYHKDTIRNLKYLNILFSPEEIVKYLDEQKLHSTGKEETKKYN